MCGELLAEFLCWNVEFEMPVCQWKLEGVWEYQCLDRGSCARGVGVGVGVGVGEVALSGCSWKR